MNTRAATPGLLCILAACSVPSSGDTTSLSALESAPVETTANPQQYSPEHLFKQSHEEFMIRKELWRPSLRASYFVMRDSQLKNEVGEFDLNRSKVDFERTMYTDADGFVRLGALWDYRDYEFSPATGVTGNTQLHQATMRLGVGRFLDGQNGDMLIEAEFQPGLWTDFDGTLHREDWQFLGNALMTWRVANDVYLKGGVEVSRLFRDLDAYPLIGLTWNIASTLRFDMLLPRMLRLTWDPSPSNSIWAGLDLDGGEFRTEINSNFEADVSVQELEFAAGAQHRFSRQLSISGRIGMTVLGDYHWQTSPTTDYDGMLEAQLFAEVGFGFDF